MREEPWYRKASDAFIAGFRQAASDARRVARTVLIIGVLLGSATISWIALRAICTAAYQWVLVIARPVSF